MKPQILDAIKKSAAVPSMPQVVMRFLEIIQDPDFSYDDVVKVLSADAGTVSELLRLANSALFGVSRKVVSLRAALTLLGPRRTRSLVLGRYLIETMGKQDPAGLDAGYYWRRSLARAALATRLADAVARQHKDEAFITALLATVGIPILAQAMPKAYGPLAARYAPHGTPFTLDEERALVETTHAEVGAEVLAHWGLPEAVCQAVGCYPLNVTGTDEAHVLARVTGAAERLARLLCEVPDTSTLVPECSVAAQHAGTDLNVLVRVLGEIEKDVEELSSILHVDVIPSATYKQIAKAIQDQLAQSTTG